MIAAIDEVQRRQTAKLRHELDGRVRVRRWVTFHGVSLNVNPDLEHYSGIVPCGVQEHGITSFADLGVDATMDDVDQVLRREFESRFGIR